MIHETRSKNQALYSYSYYFFIFQDPKSKKILHQYPLHRISYCADDKGDKKFFSFIAKDADAERHVCFVFVSDKLAEEITLTIGQAFDLAYRRFLETSGRDLEMRRQLMVLQKRVQDLEKENQTLKTKVSEYESKNGGRNIQRKKSESSSSDHLSNCMSSSVPPLHPPPARGVGRSFTVAQSVNLLDVEVELTPNIADHGLVSQQQPTVGRKLENLSLDDLDDFNPRAFDSAMTNGGILSNMSSTNGVHKPASVINGGADVRNATTNGTSNGTRDVFGSEPFGGIDTNGHQKVNGTSASDPFGMNSFEPRDYEQVIGAIDKKLAEMRVSIIEGKR